MGVLKNYYSLPQDETSVLEEGYRLGTTFCQMRKQLADLCPSCLDLPESELISDIVTDAVSDWLDSSEAYGGTPITNDEGEFYSLFHRGFSDAWQDVKAQEEDGQERDIFNRLLGDIEIDL